MLEHGLSQFQVEQIKGVLRPFSAQITQVGLFGSRACGRAQPHSDIDLVLYGDIAPATLDRVVTLLIESQLPVKVDVVAYNLIEHPSLKAHIDAVMQPLFPMAA